MRVAIVVLVALLILGGLLLLAVVWGAMAEGAVKAALADQDTHATSAQRATTVCVGLLNLGCDTAQSATTTAQRQTTDRPRSPLEVLLVLACSVPLFAVMALLAFKEGGDVTR